MSKHNDTPQVWVGCWAAYAAGCLHGAWVDATQEAEAIDAEVASILARSPVPGAEEAGIFDTEHMGGLMPGSCQGEDIARVGEFIAERGALGAAVAAHYGGCLDEAAEAFERFGGEHESLEAFAQEYIYETQEVPEGLAPYIDFGRVARDLEAGGDVLAFELGNGRVAVFWTR